MQQINVSFLKDVHSSEKRIGHNIRSDRTKTSIDIEKTLLNTPTPLPLTFDIRPIHEYYFSEYTYHDVFGGILLCTMSPEISARVVDHVFQVEEIKDIQDHCSKLTDLIFDKYNLEETENKRAKKILFLPGSNLLNAIDKELVERMMFNDDELFLKLHPITGEEACRNLGIKYGYHRLLGPKESGIAYLKQSDEIYTTANSEIGIYAAALGKKFADVTSFECMACLTYWTITRLFIPGRIEHNKQVINKVLSSVGSGWLMPWMPNIEDRIKEYYKRSMGLRAFFKPIAPKVNYQRLRTVPIKKDDVKKE